MTTTWEMVKTLAVNLVVRVAELVGRRGPVGSVSASWVTDRRGVEAVAALRRPADDY